MMTRATAAAVRLPVVVVGAVVLRVVEGVARAAVGRLQLVDAMTTMMIKARSRSLRATL